MALNSNPYWTGYSLSASANLDQIRQQRKTREEFMFGSEPIVAWRIWKVVAGMGIRNIMDLVRLMAEAEAQSERPWARVLKKVEQPCLMSVGIGDIPWSTTPEKATCVHGHPAPNLQCECGFWALRDEEAATSILHSYSKPQTYSAGYYSLSSSAAPAVYSRPAVGWAIGTVNLWGRYCEFEKGFRAEYAYPAEITLLAGGSALAERLADAYRVPVKAADTTPLLDELQRREDEAEMNQIKAAKLAAEQLQNAAKGNALARLQISNQRRWRGWGP